MFVSRLLLLITLAFLVGKKSNERERGRLLLLETINELQPNNEMRARDKVVKQEEWKQRLGGVDEVDFVQYDCRGFSIDMRSHSHSHSLALIRCLTELVL